MGKAVNLMNSGGRADSVPKTELGPTSTGGGGIPASLKVKAAGQKSASITSTGLTDNAQLKQPQNEKINNLF